MGRNRRSFRRAREWRWDPSPPEDSTNTSETERRWLEARAKSIAWACEAAVDERTVYLDTETTGFGPKAEIVDIAVVAADGSVLLDTLIKPERRIPAEVIAVHGITNDDVRQAPRWNEVYSDVRDALHDRRVVVYNVNFDRQMVMQSCEYYALDAPGSDWDCAMKRYAGFHGTWDGRKKWFSFVKLEKAVLTFGAKPGGHRAAADALACRAVVLGMAGTTPPSLDAIIDGEEAARARRPWQAPQRDELQLTAIGSLARWAHAAREFRDLLAVVPAELRERAGACGEWSPREVMMHSANWEWEGARRLRLIANNPGLPDARYDVDSFNQAGVAVRSRQEWDACVDELAKASHTFGMAAAATPDEPRTREWLTGRTTDFEEHCDGLRAWLDRQAAD